MYRIAMAAIALILAVGCAGEEAATEREDQSAAAVEDTTEKTEETAQLPIGGEEPSYPGRRAIPAEGSRSVTEGVRVALYADSSGEVTELAVAAGEVFIIHMFGEVEVPMSVSAVQYRLDTPDGIDVIAEEKASGNLSSFGDRDVLAALALGCQPPGKFQIVQFVCRANDAFTGGEFRIAEGIDARGGAFLGFVACEDNHHAKIPATGGTLTLHLK